MSTGKVEQLVLMTDVFTVLQNVFSKYIRFKNTY